MQAASKQQLQQTTISVRRERRHGKWVQRVRKVRLWAAYARTRPQPNTKYSTGLYKSMEEAVCLLHNFLRFDNEAVEEEVVSKKMKRL